MEEPAGFGIRYIWTAQVDGPALQTGIKSREYITPYRPIIVSIAGNNNKKKERERERERERDFPRIRHDTEPAK
jgi:hypothetical protein